MTTRLSNTAILREIALCQKEHWIGSCCLQFNCETGQWRIWDCRGPMELADRGRGGLGGALGGVGENRREVDRDFPRSAGCQQRSANRPVRALRTLRTSVVVS